MAERLKDYLILNFCNAKGHEIKLSITSPVQGVPNETISYIMDQIIHYGAFCGGEDIQIISKNNAQYLHTELEAIEIH